MKVICFRTFIRGKDVNGTESRFSGSFRARVKRVSCFAAILQSLNITFRLPHRNTSLGTWYSFQITDVALRPNQRSNSEEAPAALFVSTHEQGKVTISFGFTISQADLNRSQRKQCNQSIPAHQIETNAVCGQE